MKWAFHNVANFMFGLQQYYCIWLVSSLLLALVGHGMSYGITSSMLPALLAPNSPIKINLEQASWISASIGIGPTFMYAVNGYLTATFGRRLPIVISGIPSTVGPLICYYFNDLNAFIIGRFISGLGNGIGIFGALAIGEYTTPRYRGVFLALKSGSVYFGFLVVHTLNYYFDWKTVMLISSMPTLFSTLMMYTWPESPAWLASKKKYDECTKSFYYLRGKTEDSTRELMDMISAQRTQSHEADDTILTKTILFLKKFQKKSFLKPLSVCTFGIILFEFSGRHFFPAYALQIVQEVDPNPSKTFYYTISIDVLLCLGVCLSTVLVALMKRRTLLFISGISSMTVILGVCVHNFLRSMSYISHDYDVVSFVLFGCYFISINSGCVPICITLLGEIFPLEDRPTSIAVTGCILSIFQSLSLKIAPVLLSSIKFYGTFSIFSAIMIICLVFMYFTLPETKDRTLQDIDDYFTGRKNNVLCYKETTTKLYEIDNTVEKAV